MAVTIVEAGRTIVGGVDTHLDVHVAAALDAIGGVLGVESFVTTPKGYTAMLEWMSAFGTISKVGVEGTGAYEPGWTVPRSRRHRGGRGRPAQPPGAPGRKANPIPPTLSRRPGLC